jgi:hypothetical protein
MNWRVSPLAALGMTNFAIRGLKNSIKPFATMFDKKNTTFEETSV